MFLGVDHIGVGVSEMESARRFYADLGFTDVAFEYEGELPGMERLTEGRAPRAHVVLVRSERETVLGLGGLRLVQSLDRPTPPAPAPDGQGWGELGICEICLNTTGHERVYRELTQERGVEPLMDPVGVEHGPHGTTAELSYVWGPDRAKVELIEWFDLARGWPLEPGVHGVNHVAFGVADIQRSRAFYAQLGFRELLFESDGFFDPMDSWYAGEAPRQHMMLLTNPRGAGIEPVQHHPPSPDLRGAWGHAGPMDFAIGVTNLDAALADLDARGVEALSPAQTIVGADGREWRYAYIVDPDRLYVCLSEARC